MANGGKREGAGRKKGSKLITLREYIKAKDIAAFVKFLTDNYKHDTRLMTWMGDHLFTRPPQHIDHTTQGDKLPTPILTNVSSNNSAS